MFFAYNDWSQLVLVEHSVVEEKNGLEMTGDWNLLDYSYWVLHDSLLILPVVEWSFSNDHPVLQIAKWLNKKNENENSRRDQLTSPGRSAPVFFCSTNTSNRSVPVNDFNLLLNSTCNVRIWSLVRWSTSEKFNEKASIFSIWSISKDWNFDEATNEKNSMWMMKFSLTIRKTFFVIISNEIVLFNGEFVFILSLTIFSFDSIKMSRWKWIECWMSKTGRRIFLWCWSRWRITRIISTSFSTFVFKGNWIILFFSFIHGI